MEGKIYRCKWEFKNNSYKVYLLNQKKIFTFSEDFDDACVDLSLLIGETYGDGEPILEFDNPPPIEQRLVQYALPEVFILSGNCSIGTIINRQDCIEVQECKICLRKRIFRKGKENLIIETVPKADIASNYGVKIYSEKFVENLCKTELKHYELRKVITPKNSRKKFFEIIGEPLANFVGVPNFPGLVNHKCPVCNISCFTYLQYGEMYSFIAKKLLPPVIPPFFLILDEHKDLSFAMLGSELNKIRGNKGIKSLSSSRLWVVPDDNYITDNDQEEYSNENYFRPFKS